MVLDTSLLNNQQYNVRIKGKVEQSRKGVEPSPTPRCSSHWKESARLWSPTFTCVLVHKNIHHYWFPWKRSICKQISQLRQDSHYLRNYPHTHTHTHTHTHIYIYIYIYISKTDSNSKINILCPDRGQTSCRGANQNRQWFGRFKPLPAKELVGWLVGFYGISTFVGYLTPNLFFM